MMFKHVYKINISYMYDANHKGAPYTLDGKKHFNTGDLHEIVTKSVLGFSAEKDANTSFDKGSDIPELFASIKSGKATLTSTVLGNDYISVKDNYFKRVHSKLWIFAIIIDENINLYFMDKKDFALFMDNFSYFDKSRKVIRFKSASGKMITWLDKTCNSLATPCHAMPSDGTGTGAMTGAIATGEAKRAEARS